MNSLFLTFRNPKLKIRKYFSRSTKLFFEIQKDVKGLKEISKNLQIFSSNLEDFFENSNKIYNILTFLWANLFKIPHIRVL